MAVLSTPKIAIVLSFGVIGGALVFWRTSRKKVDKDEAKPRHSAEATPKLKTRIGNFKISKVKRMMEGIAEDLGAEIDFNWEKVQNLQDEHVVEDAIDTNNQTEWEKQVNLEQQIFAEAARVLGEVRQTATHRKLPHFHVVDRQLQDMEAHFREMSEDVLVFPWRESRDEPMADLMELPLLLLARDGHRALLPVSQGFVKGTQLEDRCVDDHLLLGVDADADRPMLESAFRHKARKMHAQGHCIRMDEFHALNNAYQRCLARLAETGSYHEHRSGGDILAHYVLIGTDPRESIYGESVSGILDALQRERLLMRLSVLRMWGEDERSGTGLGQG